MIVDAAGGLNIVWWEDMGTHDTPAPTMHHARVTILSN
jgi:hypothetical protein